jgi:RNase P protein component
VAEVDGQVRQAETLRVLPINAVPEGRYIVLPRSRPSFYKGIRTATIIGTGAVVQGVPQNMPIHVVFDSKHNRDALKQRIRKAFRQLRNDTVKDCDARGFVVVEGSHGEAARETIKNSFSCMPANCLGVVLLSDSGCVIPRSGVSGEVAQMMAFAGSP